MRSICYGYRNVKNKTNMFYMYVMSDGLNINHIKHCDALNKNTQELVIELLIVFGNSMFNYNVVLYGKMIAVCLYVCFWR